MRAGRAWAARPGEHRVAQPNRWSAVAGRRPARPSAEPTGTDVTPLAQMSVSPARPMIPPRVELPPGPPPAPGPDAAPPVGDRPTDFMTNPVSRELPGAPDSGEPGARTGRGRAGAAVRSRRRCRAAPRAAARCRRVAGRSRRSPSMPVPLSPEVPRRGGGPGLPGRSGARAALRPLRWCRRRAAGSSPPRAPSARDVALVADAHGVERRGVRGVARPQDRPVPHEDAARRGGRRVRSRRAGGDPRLRRRGSTEARPTCPEGVERDPREARDQLVGAGEPEIDVAGLRPCPTDG